MVESSRRRVLLVTAMVQLPRTPILEIEGIGRTKPENKRALQALGIISFDDETGKYYMRAFNDGRFLETDVKLFEDGKSLTWGFALGEIRTSSQPARKLLELTVRRQE